MGKPFETFFFLPLYLDGKWMIGSASLEVHNSVFKSREKNREFIVEMKFLWGTSEIFDKMGTKLGRKVYEIKLKKK